MKKDGFLFRILTAFSAVILLAAGLCGCSKEAPEEKNTGDAQNGEPTPYTELTFENDAQKIKYDYESYNNYLREDGVTLWPVEVPEENPFQYITAKEAVEIAESGTGIIFFGAGWCRTCRMVVTLLTETVNAQTYDNEYAKTIYYLDTDVIGEDDPDYAQLQETVLIPLSEYLSAHDEYYTNVTGTESLMERYVDMEDPGDIAKYKFLVAFYNDGVLLGANVGTTSHYVDADTPPADADYEEFTEMFWSVAKRLGEPNCEHGC